MRRRHPQVQHVAPAPGDFGVVEGQAQGVADRALAGDGQQGGESGLGTEGIALHACWRETARRLAVFDVHRVQHRRQRAGIGQRGGAQQDRRGAHSSTSTCAFR
jgi:hypothetical protein